MRTRDEIEQCDARQLDTIRSLAAAMSDMVAAGLADEFRAYCRHRSVMHANDDRCGRAPLFPNAYGQAQWAAALVRRSEMTV